MNMMKRKKTSKKNSWFVPIRGSYLPNNIMGWLTYIPFIAYIIATFYIAFDQTASNSLAILFIVPNIVVATVVMTYLASRKS